MKFDVVCKKTLAWTKYHSPEILVGTNIVSMAGSVVLAGVASTKLPEIRRKHKENICVIKDNGGDELKKNIRKENASYVWKLTKLYLPSALAFGAGTASVIGSHKIMNDRVKQLTSALIVSEETIRNLKQKLTEQLGEEEAKKLLENKKEEIVDPETGETKVLADEEDVNNDTIIINEKSAIWDDNVGFVITMLKQREQELNFRLKADGYLFLNDVYSAIGLNKNDLTETQIQRSHVVGWVYDPNNCDLQNRVDFNISDCFNNISKRTLDNGPRMVNGDPFIMLELNPDGNILTGEDGKPMFAKYIRSKYSV